MKTDTVINMLGRQMGKTTVAAGYLLWFAMFKPTAPISCGPQGGRCYKKSCNVLDMLMKVFNP